MKSMRNRFTFSFLILALLLSRPYAQVTLSTAAANNGSGGVFLRLTTNANAVTLQRFETYFSSDSGTAVSVEVYSRTGTYVGSTSDNSGWTLLGTINTVSAGVSALAPVDVTGLNISIPASTIRSFYLHSVTSGGGIRYTGTLTAPPTTTWTNASIELFSTVARIGTVAFAGTENTPRTFAGSVIYTTISLPVKWINVYGKNASGNAQIGWTVEESNVNNYNIEKQTTNGFKKVSTIMSKGDGKNEYHYTDTKAFDDNSTTAIYRIAQLDKDGHITYSPSLLVKRNVEQHTTITTYPNPFTSTVQVSSAMKQSAIVVNAKGDKVVMLQLSNGTNAVDAQSWAKGIYLLKTAAGETVKMIKQ